MIDNDSKFYSKSDYYNSYDFTELNLFNELIESSIIFNQYATFMQALETIIIRKKSMIIIIQNTIFLKR